MADPAEAPEVARHVALGGSVLWPLGQGLCPVLRLQPRPERGVDALAGGEGGRPGFEVLEDVREVEVRAAAEVPVPYVHEAERLEVRDCRLPLRVGLRQIGRGSW